MDEKLMDGEPNGLECAICKRPLTGRHKVVCSNTHCKKEQARRVASKARKPTRAGARKPTRAGARKCSICAILIMDTPIARNKAAQTAVNHNGKDLCIGCANGDNLLNELITTERVLFVKAPERTRGRARFK